jgi:hypothetical protein
MFFLVFTCYFSVYTFLRAHPLAFFSKAISYTMERIVAHAQSSWGGDLLSQL